MNSLGVAYKNYYLDLIEKMKIKKASKIPKGKHKIIECKLYPDVDDLFDINLVLLKYPKARLEYFSGRRRTMYVNNISENTLKRLLTDFGLVELIFTFEVVGTSTNFWNRILYC